MSRESTFLQAAKRFRLLTLRDSILTDAAGIATEQERVGFVDTGPSNDTNGIRSRLQTFIQNEKTHRQAPQIHTGKLREPRPIAVRENLRR